MAKKQGFKNKHLKRVVVTALATGTILISTIGFNIYDRLSNNQDTPEKPEYTDAVIGDKFDNVHGLNPSGPEITTDPSDTTPPNIFDGFVQEPEIEDEIIADKNFDEDMVEILAMLTNATRDYFESVTGRATNIEHTSVDHIQINTDGIITIAGKGTAGSNLRRTVVTIKNSNTSLSIYDLANHTSNTNTFNKEFRESLEEVLASPRTEYSVKTDTYYKVTNPKIATTLLNARLTELKSSDANNPEIKFINNLLSNPGKLDPLIFDTASAETDYGNHKNAFTLILSTDKYGYTAQGGFETTYQLRGNDKYVAIENYVQNNISSIAINSTPQSEINKILYEINEKAEELQNNNSLTK